AMSRSMTPSISYEPAGGSELKPRPAGEAFDDRRQGRRIKRWIYWSAGLVLLLMAAGYFLFRPSKSKYLFETAQVERGSLAARVTASGTLSAVVTVQVGSQVSGRLAEIFVDFNSPVKKGQVMARIDPQLLQAALQQAESNYAAAQANLKKAKVQALDADRQYRRTKALSDQKLVSPADLDTAEAAAQVARSQIDAMDGALKQTRAAMDLARVNLGYTTIVSPIDGIVISRNVDVGQTVAASLQAPTLFTIAKELRKMQVDTNVAEADVGKLSEGMAATFTVDAYPGERFHAAVGQIRYAPQTVQNVVTYNAVLSVENPDLRLRPGMTANVTFVYATREAVLKIPNAAVRFRPPPEAVSASEKPALIGPGPAAGEDPARKTVWALRNGAPAAVPIRVGLSDGLFTEVVEGKLSPGEPLITSFSVANR
ncbi:MAG TPA: efflux RND transporter periplasmic adaptor subunit, partial [Candidatus Manganitrophaceae bacterium]|nr:efflux RND transporter periplasmic adaptor subunit [Candidatus Manganitrophaceae bacterium]